MRTWYGRKNRGHRGYYLPVGVSARAAHGRTVSSIAGTNRAATAPRQAVHLDAERIVLARQRSLLWAKDNINRTLSYRSPKQNSSLRPWQDVPCAPHSRKTFATGIHSSLSLPANPRKKHAHAWPHIECALSMLLCLVHNNQKSI